LVGPNRTFMEYVSHVLPTLGEEAVAQLAVGELVEGLVPARADSQDVALLKGDERVAAVLRRAVGLRLAEARPEGLLTRLDGAFVEVDSGEVEELATAARQELGTTKAARDRFAMNLLRTFYVRYGERLGGSALRTFDEIERALRKGGYWTRVVERAWPAIAPDRLVRTLLGSRARLAAAAEGILAPEEQQLLLRARPRRGEGWSEADVALVDEANALVGTPPKRFGHVIVDEAQDLTPMQLRMVARRAASGRLTLLGDIAQATGPVSYGGWSEVLRPLPRGEETSVEELRHAYRVPREIIELALPLLERIAPDVEPPLAYRTGADPPRIRRVAEEHLLEEALREAATLAALEGLLAVIVPPRLLEPALSARSLFDERVPLLTPREAKGLEFDHVVVVEPAAIAEAEQGLRELYVALTRPTRTLVVVHARPLPAPLADGEKVAGEASVPSG
jgi:DNA helicase IV